MDQPESLTPNQNRILEAARDLIREQGMDALSVRKLAARSGLALKTIYNLYGNKTNVLVALFEQGTQGMDQAMDQLAAEMARREWRTEFYLDWLARVEPLFLENQAVIKPAVMAGFSGPCPEAADQIHCRRIRRLQEALELAAQKDLIRTDLDLEVSARLLYTHYFTAVIAWARGDLDDRGFIVQSRYAILTLLHTLINAPDRRENCIRLLKSLKEEK